MTEVPADYHAAVHAALTRLDGTTTSAAALLTGMTPADINSLGGIPDDQDQADAGLEARLQSLPCQPYYCPTAGEVECLSAYGLTCPGRYG